MKQLFILLVFSLSYIQISSNNLVELKPSTKDRQTYVNPVIRGDIADPSVIKIDDIYFMAGTSSEWAPHYPTYTSKDLINWKQVGYIFNEKPEWTINSFWAPELYQINGKIYCYYTARRKSDNVSVIGVAVADSYTNKFVDHGVIIEHEKEAIDAFVYNDNGQLYISWKAYGLDNRPIELLASKLSSDGLKLEGESFSLLKDDEGIGMEGQAHYKFGDYYYLIYAGRSCCGFDSDYDIRVARAKDFKGPYEKYYGNPIMYGGNHDFISIGHGTLITTEEERHYYLCHGYINGESRYLGRQPVIQELVMNNDMWLVAKNGTIANIEGEVPYTNTTQLPVEDIRDNFKNEELAKYWTWNYTFNDVKTHISNGNIVLSGIPKGELHTGAALCIKPQTPNYYYETKIIDSKEGFSGLTMYGDNKNLVAWGKRDGSLILKYIKNGETESMIMNRNELKDTIIKIEVKGGHLLTFWYKDSNDEWTIAPTDPIDVSSLAPWDRTFRAGLLHHGESNSSGTFEYFNLINE